MTAADIGLPRGAAIGYLRPVLRNIKGRRLVLVEDDAAIRDSLCDYFNRENEVFAFSRAEEVLAARDALTGIHVFIIDYKLPEMNGAELFARLRGGFTAARFILITGEMNYDVAQSTEQMGWDALILKPFDFGILEDNIAVLVPA